MSMRGLDPSVTTRLEVERVAREVTAAAAAFPTATLHEAAGKIGALPHAIKPVSNSFRLSGPALTVHSPGGDNLWLHRALYVAQPGDVLVVNVSGAYDHGYWGEIMSTAAKHRGLAGLVIDGCVRDGVLLETIGFPVFARGLCIRGTGKDFDARGWINAPTPSIT
jgi:4-hydroxy-4-methyl-2-oxoglutarate aldolase